MFGAGLVLLLHVFSIQLLLCCENTQAMFTDFERGPSVITSSKVHEVAALG